MNEETRLRVEGHARRWAALAAEHAGAATDDERKRLKGEMAVVEQTIKNEASIEELRAMAGLGPELPEGACHDCGAELGRLHDPGCDVEVCPWCGGQMISCDCPPDRDAWIGAHRIPWNGVWNGEKEAVEAGFYVRWIPDAQFEADRKEFGETAAVDNLRGRPLGRWEACGKDHPDARPDINRVHLSMDWDREKARFVERA